MEHQRVQAGYCAMRALALGQSLPCLTPVVGRAYASLCLVESAAEKSSSWTISRYKRKALETTRVKGLEERFAAARHYNELKRNRDGDELTSLAEKRAKRQSLQQPPVVAEAPLAEAGHPMVVA